MRTHLSYITVKIILIFLFPFCQLFAQEDEINLALEAQPSTSFVSSWETLGAINNGHEPVNSADKSSGAYGNWPSPNLTQWVQYDWSKFAVISSVEVYWFDDDGGVLTPTEAYLEYFDGEGWERIGDVPVVKDTWNVLHFDQVKTSKLRLSMRNEFQSTGILEWKVLGTFEEGSELPVGEKTVFIPWEWASDPALQNWSWDRSYEGENFVVFWGPEVTGDPRDISNPELRFNPKGICDTLEISYKKFIDEIKFASDAPNTNLGKYKTIVVMNNTWGEGGPSGWAFGGAYSNTIGAMWVAAAATRNGLVLSHEFAHTLQSMNSIQENKVGGGFMNFEPAGFFWEAHANFMRNQVYPYSSSEDTPRWLGTRMYHYSSTRHQYSAYRLLFVIQQIDGIEMVNRLWRESVPQEHPLMTYKRLKEWDQEQLNDFIYEYGKRDVIYDYTVNNYGAFLRKEETRILQNEPHMLWRRYTVLKELNRTAGAYIVPDEMAPQDYGINVIPLYPKDRNGAVTVKFSGHTEVNGTAGWRYGFVTSRQNGTVAHYEPAYSDNDEVISYTMSSADEQLFLVVVGAPTEHTSYVWEPGWPKIKRYPYELQIENAEPEGRQSAFRTAVKNRINGASHPNGGGFVANSATVSSSAYVGPHAMVLGNSTISGNVQIKDYALVSNATISENVAISGNAIVFSGTYSGNAQVTEGAIAMFSTLHLDATLKGNALLWGGTYGGDILIGGDAEIGSCSSGVYLQSPHSNNGRTACDRHGAGHASNQDINNPVVPFYNETVTSLNKNDNAPNYLSTYPNPVQQYSDIHFNLLHNEKVTLKVFNSLGQEVITLINEEPLREGLHSLKWYPGDIRDGIYIYKLIVKDSVLSKKIIYKK